MAVSLPILGWSPGESCVTGLWCSCVWLSCHWRRPRPQPPNCCYDCGSGVVGTAPPLQCPGCQPAPLVIPACLAAAPGTHRCGSGQPAAAPGTHRHRLLMAAGPYSTTDTKPINSAYTSAAEANQRTFHQHLI